MLREYLVECGGRLLMVTRYIRSMARATGPDFFEHHKTAGFTVFEADLNSRPGRWIRVNKLGGQALFVGKHCSRAFPAGESGAQEDCISFMYDYPWPDNVADPLRDSGIYNLENGMITPLLTGTAAVPPHRVGQSRPPDPLNLATATMAAMSSIVRRSVSEHDEYLDSAVALELTVLHRSLKPLWPATASSKSSIVCGPCCRCRRHEVVLICDSDQWAVAQTMCGMIMASKLQSSSWADFQPELLGIVLRRLPSHADRVRLRAVCRPWRSNAQMQSFPPPLPWLALLDGTFLDIASCAIHRMTVPEDACCHGSLDNWLFLMKSDGGCSLMNPFSRAKLKLPKLGTCIGASRFKPPFYKLVVPSPLDSSPDSLVAALTLDYCNFSRIFICQPPVTTDSSKGKKPLERITDVAFFDGKLYAISKSHNLFILEITGRSRKKPTILAVDFLINSMDHIGDLPEPLLKDVVYISGEYLVECSGRLLMVTRYIHHVAHATGHDFFEHHRTAGFEVFEADLTNIPGRWRRVNNLGGQALFVGEHCSKAFPAGESGGAQEDCIYFICDYPPPEFAADPLRDSGVYNMRDGMIKPLLAGIAADVPHRVGQSRPTWLFPTDTILACMMAATQSSSWADLQLDILGLVLRRLPSLADRVRLRAVCRPWRSNAQLQTVPRPLPWLTLLDGTFLSISDGEIHRMPLPDDASCYGSIDSWLFLRDSDDGCSLMNPFSKTTLQLPNLASIWHHERGDSYNASTRLFYKLAVPLPLDLSPDSLVAVLINDPLRHGALCIVHRSIATDSFRFHDRPFENNFYDIAFCGGKLYALSCGKLFTVEMSEVQIGKPKVPHVQCIVEEFPTKSHSQPCPENRICVTWPYLVESGGRLLNVIRRVGVPFPPVDDDDIFKDSLTFSFEVYEADLSTGSRKWRRVKSLGDQTLFIGRHCPKSLSAAECVGAQEDCIYFMCDGYFQPNEDPLCDAGIYNMRSGVITPLLQETTAPRLHPTGEGHPTWFFPADGAIFHRLVASWAAAQVVVGKIPCTDLLGDAPCRGGRRTLILAGGRLPRPAAAFSPRSRAAPATGGGSPHRSWLSAEQIATDFKSCMMMAAIQSSSWADLQPELLGLVLTRPSSLADRVRLRAVCRPWRSNARLQPLPPPLPWLTLLDGTFLSISDGEIHRMPLPDDASCHCSIDNWHEDGGFSLMNPFSKATLQLPKLDTIWCHHLWYAEPKFPLFYKLAVPSPLVFSPRSLVFALIMNRSHQKALCMCQSPVATESFRVEGSTMEGMKDFTFLDGKLYVIKNFNKLFILEIDESHIVESDGGLLMVTRYVGIVLPLAEPNSFENSRTLSFEVFEAGLTTDSRMWRRVTSLGGRALFVGTHCSNSLPAAECGVPQENCIYFMCDYWRPDAGDPLCDSGVYNMRNGVITPLLQDATAPRLHPTGRGDPAWFFPADVAMRWSRRRPAVAARGRTSRRSSWASCSSACRPTPTASASAPSAAHGAPARGALPWLFLPDGAFLTLPNGAVHRLAVPGDVAHLVSTGSDLLLLAHNNGMFSLMNPLSWRDLFQAKLYCLTDDIEKCQEELYILEIGDEEPMMSDVKCIHSTPKDVGDEAWFNPHSTDSYTVQRYLVTDGDRLLMVVRWINLPPMLPRDSSSASWTRRFEVFEAVDLSGGHGRWIKVGTLMGHSLFTIFVCNAGTDTHVDTARYTAMLAELPAAAAAAGDIAFFQGKLYAVTRTMELYLIELSEDSGGSIPTIAGVECVIRDRDEPVVEEQSKVQGRYLLDSGDRLLLVRRWAWAKYGITHRFQVLEADLAAASPGRWWTAAPSLRGRALFVGNRGSRSLLAAGDGRCGAQEDCIYFLRRQANKLIRLPVVDVYNVRDGTMASMTLSSPETSLDESWDPICQWTSPEK
uniref:F-box domain-containing protein n=1 Tax=Oryza punctata TaxID=4537 RepID=A0A0E0L7V2_ORYPU